VIRLTLKRFLFLGELRDEIRSDQASLKEFLVQSFANISNSKAAQQKGDTHQTAEEARGGAQPYVYPHYYMASPVQHPAMTPVSAPPGFMPPPQGHPGYLMGGSVGGSYQRDDAAVALAVQRARNQDLLRSLRSVSESFAGLLNQGEQHMNRL
jgi:hypothetical protein